MNCREFEKVINDLAGGQLMDAVTRARGQAHTATCARCALRLADERVLTAGLRALAESTRAERAPAHLKPALRAAFDEHTATAVRVAPTPRRVGRGWRWGLAAAAALALLAITAAFGLRMLSPDPKQVVDKATPTQAPVPREPAPQQIVPRSDRGPEKVQQVANKPAPGPSRRPSRRHPAPGDVASQPEVATDYIPLTYLADATALHSGTVVRVEVPRSTLIAMGLPLNAERAHALVKADVLLGDDGVARAIRFIQ
jgi:hypothetical protein